MSQHYSTTWKRLKHQFWMDSSEFRLTLLGAGWFIMGAYIVSIANSYLDQANPSLLPELEKRHRLPDPLLEHLSNLYYKFQLPVELSQTLVRIAPVLFLFRCFTMGNKSLLVLRRVFYVLGASYLLRMPFVLMTVLPNPLLTCVSHPEPHLLYDAFLLLIQKRASCGDVLFSGHTIMFMLVALTWFEYPPKNNVLANLTNSLSLLFTLFSILVLIGSTFHYTVDCVIGVIMVLILWRGYHFIVSTNYCDNTWYSSILLFCDGERHILSSNPEFAYELCADYLV